MTDKQALNQFVQTRSTDAFAVLVRRYIDLVYSTARRIARDPHLADDATQAVFIVLARRADSINPIYLAGWLVNTARLASRDVLRTRKRQHRRDIEAAQMRSEIHFGDEPTSEQISPLLDDALARLGDADRSAVVMRFLQGRSFLDVGQALGTSEEAARKRVERAIEKLRAHLFSSGLVPSNGGLCVILAAHQAGTAPVTLMASDATQSGVAAATIAKGVVWTMNMTKGKITAGVILIVVSGIGGGITATLALRHLAAGPPPAVQAASLPVSADAPAAAPKRMEEKILPDDRVLVDVQVPGTGGESEYRSRVDASGRIYLPLLGQVQVGGKLPSEIETDIAKIYGDEPIITYALVHVTTDEHAAGALIKAGPCQIGEHILFHISDLGIHGTDMSAVYVVDANGEIPTPAANKDGTKNPPGLDHIKVAGLSEFEASEKITRAYAANGILPHAQLSVERISAKEAEDYAAQPRPTVNHIGRQQ